MTIKKHRANLSPDKISYRLDLDTWTAIASSVNGIFNSFLAIL